MAAFDTTPGSCYGGPAVAAFTPICSFDPLTPTTPVTFDVPAPHIVLPLPPQECVCFDFTPGTANAATTPSCVNQATASVSVAITPDTDCCSGKYVVTPSIDLNIPCMPFQVSSHAPVVHNRSNDETSASGHGTDGSVESFYVRKGTGAACCTLESALVITLPDCVKDHPKLEDGPQITFCERTSNGTVATRTVSDFITLEDDPEHCTFYPVIKELTLPCCSLPDLHLGNRIYLEGVRTDGQARDYIDWHYDRVNCETSLSFTPSISCKCLSFAGTDGATTATAEATPSLDVSKAKVSVTIDKKAGTNCCDGAFTVTPEIEIPACSVADVEETTTRHYLTEDHRGGYFDLTFSMTDCKPDVSVSSVELPCVCPEFTSGSHEVDPSFATKKAKISIDIDQDGTDCCNPKFTITPEIEIPACPLDDIPETSTRFELGNGGYAYLKQSFTDCVPTVEIDAHPVDCPFTDTEIRRSGGIGYGGTIELIATRKGCDWDFTVNTTPIEINIPVPCVPSVSTTPVHLNFKYKDKNGTTKTTDTGSQTPTNNRGVSLTMTSNGNACPTYTPTFSGTLDLTDIGGGGGIGGDGDCFQPTGDDDVYIDGDTKQDWTWYGGGIGDRQYDYINTTDCRGPVMRGTGALQADEMIPYCSPATNLIGVDYNNTPAHGSYVLYKDVANGSKGSSVNWASARAIESGSGDNVTVARGFASGSAHGNLSMTMPAGFQWNTRGIATTMSTFMYNSSGVLSWVEEARTAPILAPGLSVTLNAQGVETTDNASGLAIVPHSSMSSKLSPGLAVKAGDGLRIYGCGDGSHTDDDTYTKATTQADRQGALEIHYGAGFRIIETPADQNTEPVYHSKPSGTAGAIEVNYGLGLRMLKTPKNGNTPADYESHQDATAGAIEVNYGAGLRMIETVTAGTPPTYTYRSDTSRTKGALEVNYGKGLRMVKNPASGNTATTYETAPAEMAGALEVQYGPGFRAIKDKNGSTDATKYVSNPSTENNAIVPFDGRGLCVKGVTKTNSSETVSEQNNAMEIYKNPVDFEFKANGQLALNDKKTANETKMATNGTMGSFTRGETNEVVVPIVVGDVFSPWFVRTTSGAWRPNIDYFMSEDATDAGDDIWSLMSSFYVMYLHVTRSGLVLSIDTNNSSAGITRLSDAAS